MILKQTGGLSFYQFPHLAGFPEVRHGVFTRFGGLSRGPYESLNISHALGDDERRVKENRMRMLRCLGKHELVFVRQIHGVRVESVDGGPAAPEEDRPPADALVTDHDGKLLVVQVADCQPVLLYDPVRKVAAAVHSGWRGSIADIIGRTVAAMQHRYGSRPADVHAGIGPSLGPCCAEFLNYRTEIPRHLWQYRGPDSHFDFWAISRDQLRQAGVPAKNIVVSGLCTRCRTDTFFSYRGEKVTGRFAGVIGMV